MKKAKRFLGTLACAAEFKLATLLDTPLAALLAILPTTLLATLIVIPLASLLDTVSHSASYSARNSVSHG